MTMCTMGLAKVLWYRFANVADNSQIRYQKLTLADTPMAVIKENRFPVFFFFFFFLCVIVWVTLVVYEPHFQPIQARYPDMLEDKTQQANTHQSTVVQNEWCGLLKIRLIII